MKEWDINNVIMTGNNDGVVRVSLPFARPYSNPILHNFASLVSLSALQFGVNLVHFVAITDVEFRVCRSR